MKPLKNYLGRETDQPPDSIRQLATISDNNRQPPLEAILRGAGGFYCAGGVSILKNR